MPRSLLVFLVVLGTAHAAAAQETIPRETLARLKRAAAFVKVTIGPLKSSGSGFVVQTDGQTVYLVTNEHVVAKPDLPAPGDLLPFMLRGRDRLELQRILQQIAKVEPEVTVVFNSGTSDEEVLKAETLITDKQRDLAILKVTGLKSVPDPVVLETSFKPTETTTIFTFGYPFGDALSNVKGNPAVTIGRGAISSFRLDEQAEQTVVQIDGALNPGNSGGPVVDVEGRLVGVAVAAITGTGIGFAVPPISVHQLLAGRATGLNATTHSGSEGLEIDLTLTLLDPFHKLGAAAAHCVCSEVKAVLPVPQQPLDGSEKVDLKIEKGKASGTWKVPASAKSPDVVTLQVAYVDGSGATVYLKPLLHRLRAVSAPAVAGPGSRPRPVTPNRPVVGLAKPDSALAGRKVNQGTLTKLGERDLVGGVFVMGTGRPVVGLGLVQTGAETREFTYVTIVRLPSGDPGRTSFLTSNKTANGQTRTTFIANLGDESVMVEHSYTVAGQALGTEEFKVQDDKYDPSAGRLFLIDLSQEPGRVTQVKAELPTGLPVRPIDDRHLVDLADQTLEDLSQRIPEVREFVKPK